MKATKNTISNISEVFSNCLLWVLWTEMNRIIFKSGKLGSIRSIGTSLISLATYWCKRKRNKSFLNLQLLLLAS
jgi:hypothetical protein